MNQNNLDKLLIISILKIILKHNDPLVINKK